VHAGEDEAAGGGALGSTAIWSHSWYVNYGDIGDTGPGFNKQGGTQVGNSSYWVGKYTIQPENGGVGVFVHEFGHDWACQTSTTPQVARTAPASGR